MSDELYEAERTLFEALCRSDLAAVAAMLTDDFVITTAGWLAEPADKATWLDGLAEHELEEFDLEVLTVRSYDPVAVVLAESEQAGTRAGEPWRLSFRYTDVWRKTAEGWRLAVRHASAKPT